MTSWFLSDLHLRDINERNGNTLLRFLFELNTNPQENRLFLLGDIFDGWVSDGSAFVLQFQPLVDELTKFKRNGGEVFYFEGNHDVHIDRFWTRLHGIKVFDEMQYMQIDGLTVRMEHGDYINPDDEAYFKYLSIIRHPFVEMIGHILPSRFWQWITLRQSMKSRKKSARYAIDFAERIRAMIRAYALKAYGTKPFDILVTGHMHVFDDYTFEVGGKKARSINLGTWLEKPRVLKIKNQQIEIINL